MGSDRNSYFVGQLLWLLKPQHLIETTARPIIPEKATFVAFITCLAYFMNQA